MKYSQETDAVLLDTLLWNDMPKNMYYECSVVIFTFIILCANSADEKSMILFLNFQENKA